MKRLCAFIAGLLLSLSSLPAHADGTGVTSYTARRVVRFTGAPSNPAEGDIYENLTSHLLFYYNGSAFQQLSVLSGALGNATATSLAIGGTHRYAIDTYGTGATQCIHVSLTDVDSGGYFCTTGTTNFVLGGGVVFDGANWIAKTATPAFIQSTTTGFNLFADIGQTIGASYSPTLRAQITTAGIVPVSTLGIVGTITNDNTATGSVGEYVTGTVAANTTSLSTTTTANVGANTNISLTAGDWDCSGVVNFTLGATTSVTNLSGGVSTTSATLPAQDSYFDFETAANVMTATKVATFVCPTVRLSLASTTNVFLVTQATFTISTAVAGGTIRCRRVR